MNLTDLGKIILIIGLFMVVAGGLVMVMGRIPGLGRLPGDIFVQRGNFTFYFPVVTMIIVSIVLTLLLNLLFRR